MARLGLAASLRGRNVERTWNVVGSLCDSIIATSTRTGLEECRNRVFVRALLSDARKSR